MKILKMFLDVGFMLYFASPLLPDLFHPESMAKVSMLNGTLATFSSLFPQTVLTKVAKSDVALPYYIASTAMVISAVVMTIGLADVIKQD